MGSGAPTVVSVRAVGEAIRVPLWAAGAHFNVRLKENRTCVLALMDATAESQKDPIAVADGHRQSEQSWVSLLLDVRQRGMSVELNLATGYAAPAPLVHLRTVSR